jgi:hypothetical protein
MLRSIAAECECSCSHSRRALRCSRSMRAMSWRPHPSRRAHAHATLRERLRMRAPQDEDSRARGSSPNRFRLFPSHDVKQPISFPRRMSAPEFCIVASLTPNEGWAERRETFGCVRSTRGARHDAACHARRLASHDAGRSPLGAPPWRFWAPGAALPSPWAPAVLQRRAGAFGSVQRAPRTQVVVPGGRGPEPPEASGYEPPAAGRHSPLRLQDRLRRRPSMSEDANPVA